VGVLATEVDHRGLIGLDIRLDQRRPPLAVQARDVRGCRPVVVVATDAAGNRSRTVKLTLRR